MKSLLIDSTDSRYGPILKMENGISIGYKLPEESDLNGDFVNIDTFISNGSASIISQIASCNIDYYIIPLSLTTTPLDFSGIRLAQHIRLTQSLSEKRFLPIIFVSWMDPLHIIKLADGGDMITASGNHLCKPHKDEIDKVVSGGLNSCNIATDKINISSHNQSSSHHSTANEWSILTLSQALGLNEKIKEQIDYFRAQLYFKYLLAKVEIPAVSISSIPNFNLTGQAQKILFIDDEYQKGWDEIFTKIFSNQVNIGYSCYKPAKQFTDFETSDELVDDIEKTILSYDPDIILLDLRLHDEDFEKDKTADDMTGLKILKKIKEKINPGLQVIAITASNKVWNLLELQNRGIDGFILKISPENEITTVSYNFFENLKYELRKATERSFLKKIAIETKMIKEHLTSISSVGGGGGLMALAKLKLKNEVIIQLDQAFELLKGSFKNDLNFSWSFLSYYKIYELLNDYYIEYNPTNKQLVFRDTGAVIESCQYNNAYSFAAQAVWDPYKTSTSLKIYNILKKLSFDITRDVSHIALARKIYSYQLTRKKFIHPDNLADYQKMRKEDCLEINQTLGKIFPRIV